MRLVRVIRNDLRLTVHEVSLHGHVLEALMMIVRFHVTVVLK